jgi:hypothetical protein
VRHRLHKVAVVLIVALCLCCYIAEICDTWDAAVHPDSDTEFSFVRVLLCIGATFVLADVLRIVFNLLARARKLSSVRAITAHFLKSDPLPFLDTGLGTTLTVALRI